MKTKESRDCFRGGDGAFEPKGKLTVRKYVNKHRERREFWHQRFLRAGVLGVGPRAFYEEFGEAFSRGELWAIEKWNKEEKPFLSNLHRMLLEEIDKIEMHFCAYEPAAGPGEITSQEMSTILMAGGEWFASDFDKLPVKMCRERVRLLQPAGQDWTWRVSHANAANFKKWIEQFRPPPVLRNPVKAAIICRACKHLDDEVFSTFLRQVGQTMDFVLLAEAVLDGFDKHGIRIGVDRPEKPGTKYRYLEQHAKLLGMEVKTSQECINFGDPYFIGILTHKGR